jgi:hypothetical protein
MLDLKSVIGSISITEKVIAFTWVGSDAISLWLILMNVITFFVEVMIALIGQVSEMRSLKRFVHRHSFRGF